MANTKKDWNGSQHDAYDWLEEFLEDDEDPNVRELATKLQEDFSLTADQVVDVVEQSSLPATSETIAAMREVLV